MPYVRQAGSGGAQLDQWVASSRATEPLAIGDLVYPLRYDILCRAEFVRYYKLNRDASIGELGTGIGPWYRSAMYNVSRRWHIWWGNDPLDPERLEQLFLWDLERMVNLVEFMEGQDFVGEPVHIIRPKEILPSISGKWVSGPFLGDGQHRVAILLERGVRFLQPEQYVYLEYETYSPWEFINICHEENFFRRAYAFKE